MDDPDYVVDVHKRIASLEEKLAEAEKERDHFDQMWIQESKDHELTGALLLQHREFEKQRETEAAHKEQELHAKIDKIKSESAEHLKTVTEDLQRQLERAEGEKCALEERLAALQESFATQQEEALKTNKDLQEQGARALRRVAELEAQHSTALSALTEEEHQLQQRLVSTDESFCPTSRPNDRYSTTSSTDERYSATSSRYSTTRARRDTAPPKVQRREREMFYYERSSTRDTALPGASTHRDILLRTRKWY